MSKIKKNPAKEKTIKILGINISTREPAQILEEINNFLNSSTQHYIVTPNPEILLRAQKDELYFSALNQADLGLPDGMGIKIAGWFSGVNLKRITGADITVQVLEFCQKNHVKVAIMNWRNGLSDAEDISFALRSKYSGLDFQVIDTEREWHLGDYGELNVFRPTVLFVTFGNPFQEKFIYKNLKKFPYVKLALAVGGSFDFLTGKTARAPKLFRDFGFEWLWRLIRQGKGDKAWKKSVRLKRIFNAIIIFPLFFIRYRFIRPFLYRPNVACLMYRIENGRKKIFIVERAEESGHWQLPQGGLDGQNLRTAGIRELTEESGSHKFKIMGVYQNIYKYKFGTRDNENQDRASQGRARFGYKGQKQGLVIAEYYGTDNELRIKSYDHTAWRWVDESGLIDAVHPVRRAATKLYLDLLNKLS